MPLLHDKSSAIPIHWTDALKAGLARILPPSAMQALKKAHYARKLRKSSIWEEKELALSARLIEKGDTVVDIGANIGLYSRHFAERVGPSGRVISIEPVPETFEILTSNMGALGLRNVDLVNAAVSDRAGELSMTVPSGGWGAKNFYRAHIVSGGSEGSAAVSVRATTLDALVGSYQRVAFIKCDVEGHEAEALRGAISVINASRPACLVEVSRNPDIPGTSAHEVFDLMRLAGLAPYVYDGRSLRMRRRGDRSVNYFFLNKHHLRALSVRGVALEAAHV